MNIISIILTLLVAVLFFYIMYLETFVTDSDSTSRVFNISKEELKRPNLNILFKNQAIYGGLTSDKKIILKQGGLPILALISLFF